MYQDALTALFTIVKISETSVFIIWEIIGYIHVGLTLAPQQDPLWVIRNMP